MRFLISIFVLIFVLSPGRLYAQAFPSEEVQIAAAVSPLPQDLQEGAAVMGYKSDGSMTMLKEGTNDMICIADNPGDDRFHAACYQLALDPFMSRGRQLASEGKSRDENRATRKAEIEAGTLSVPDGPAALYQLFGEASSLNLDTGEVSNVRPLYVMYIPYATTESTGLSSQAPMPGAPWLMDAGEPWAHIMYSPVQP